ncbi:MAG: phasin family protein [Proteobacteria bacterium]|nr:phasin family protein [Pseudomonadota bacterium]
MATKSFNKFTNDAFGAFKDFKMPRVDFEGAMSAHRKNMEAFTKAQRAAFDAVKSLSQAHQDYLKEAFGDMRNHMKEVTQAKSLEDRIEAQTRQMRAAFEKAMSHGRNMSQTCKKAQKEASDVWSKRFTEGAAEAKGMMRKAQETVAKQAKH